LNAVPIRPHPVSSQMLLYPRSTSAHSMLNSHRGTEDSESMSCSRSIIRPSGSTMLMPYGLDRGPRYIQWLVCAHQFCGITMLHFRLNYFDINPLTSTFFKHWHTLKTRLGGGAQIQHWNQYFGFHCFSCYSFGFIVCLQFTFCQQAWKFKCLKEMWHEWIQYGSK
jgi:hypothetical protein